MLKFFFRTSAAAIVLLALSASPTISEKLQAKPAVSNTGHVEAVASASQPLGLL